MNTEELDVQKLNAEILQLRNQQFHLGTLALAGSGLTAFIAPAATAVTDGRIPAATLGGASLCWLVLLTLLYSWSLSLWVLIASLSKYLELRELSPWEPFYRTLQEDNKKVFPSQSRFVALAFTLYGILAVGSGMLAASQSDGGVELSLQWSVGLGCALVLYVFLVWYLHGTREKRTKRVERAIRIKLNLPVDPADGGSDAPQPREAGAGTGADA